MNRLLTFTGIYYLVITIGFSVEPIAQQTIRSTSNQIDLFIAGHLEEKQIEANSIIDDATFLRRAYINITGRIPTAEEAGSFINDDSQDKRRKLIDTLIDSEGYKSRMFNFWADLLRVQTNLDKHGLGWHVWIHKAVDQNMPYDDFVHAMLSSNGLVSDDAAVGYYLRDREMLLDNVSNTTEVFLGTQIGCAQCHDHPFDDWTQKQYFELAAFIGNTTYKSDAAKHLLSKLVEYSFEKDGKLKGKQGEKSRKLAMRKKGAAAKYYKDYSSLFKDFGKAAVSEDPKKTLRLPKDYQYNDGKPGDILIPKTLFGEAISEDVPLEQRREAFARWVTSSENPLFTKVIVNRLWAEVFGRGIVDPLDDWSDTKRISHPELLDYLCEIMRATQYDTKQFMRVLYHTRLFESSACVEEAKRGGQHDFQGPVLRRMSAEEIHDSFLTLEFGNQDQHKNESLAYRWNSYVQSVDKLFSMSMPELIELNQETDALEERIYAARAEATKLRIKASRARAEGNTEQAKELEQEARNKVNDSKKLNQQSNSMMAASMMQNKMRTKPRQNMRASEQSSPSRPGTFLRQFGSSDRMTPDASHSLASTPQALTLLNGREVAKLTDGKGQLAASLRQAESPTQRLDTLFLSIYGCMPTVTERQQLEPLTTNTNQLRTLARAMLNSKRFLFVQ